MSKLHELKAKRAQLHEQQKEILAASDKNGFSAEDESKFDNLDAEIDKLGEEVDRIEKAQAKVAERDKQLSQASSKTQDFYAAHRSLADEAAGEVADLFADFDGHDRQKSLDQVANSKANKEFLSAFDKWMAGSADQAAMQHTRQGEGGYLVMPEQYIARLIQNVDDLVHIRKLATVIPLKSAASIGVPTRENDLDDADWTSEIAPVREDESLRFGKRKMIPQPISKLVKISRDLLKIAVLQPEAILRQRLSQKFAVTEEKAFMLGDGNDKPLGLFVASEDGIPTSRDVSNQNEATKLTPEGLINAKYFLKPQYMMSKSLRWMFHRDAIRDLRKMRYGTNDEHFVWKPGLEDKPDTILEVPFIMSEYCPNTFTASQYVGLLGDFSHYWIVEVMKLEVQRLNELYATTNQTGFIGRAWLDGAPALAEAFVRVKLGG